MGDHRSPSLHRSKLVPAQPMTIQCHPTQFDRHGTVRAGAERRTTSSSHRVMGNHPHSLRLKQKAAVLSSNLRRVFGHKLKGRITHSHDTVPVRLPFVNSHPCCSPSVTGYIEMERHAGSFGVRAVDPVGPCDRCADEKNMYCLGGSLE